MGLYARSNGIIGIYISRRWLRRVVTKFLLRMGNSRGNKYSCKHRRLKPSDEEFWDFSIDEMAKFDLQDSIDYILKTTGAPSLTYIGFSQGTAQGFAALSSNFDLARKVNLFIALAPSTKPLGLKNKSIRALVHTSPEVVFLLFGRKCMLSSTCFWSSILTPETFSWIIDIAINGLFGWKSDFIENKTIVYRHLYSYSSVKVVVSSILI